MANPHDLLVRYFVTTGLDSEEQVNAKLREFGLPSVGHNDVTKQLAFIEKNLPPYIAKQVSEGKQDAEFVRWMSVLGVGEPWISSKQPKNHISRSWELATEMVQNERIFLTASSLILKAVPKNDIVELCNMRFQLNLKLDDLAVFRKFFFEPHHMKKEDWKPYLNRIGKTVQKSYFLALTGDLNELKNELGLPANIDVSVHIQDLLIRSFSKAKTFMEASDPCANREARAWTNTALVLSEKFQKFRAGNANDFGKNLQLEFDFVDHEFDKPDADVLEELMPTPKTN